MSRRRDLRAPCSCKLDLSFTQRETRRRERYNQRARSAQRVLNVLTQVSRSWQLSRSRKTERSFRTVPSGLALARAEWALDKSPRVMQANRPTSHRRAVADKGQYLNSSFSRAPYSLPRNFKHSRRSGCVSLVFLPGHIDVHAKGYVWPSRSTSRPPSDLAFGVEEQPSFREARRSRSFPAG